MSAVTKFLVAVVAIVAVGLAGCSPSPNTIDGKTAEQWKKEADQWKTRAEGYARIAKPDGNKPQPSVEEKIKKQAEEHEKKRVEANETFLASADQQAQKIASSKNGEIIVEATQIGLDDVSTGNISLNNMAGSFIAEAMSKVVPEVIFAEPLVGNEHKVLVEGRKKIRQAVVKWLTSDHKRLDLVWSTIRPTLRQKYSLLNTLRGHEKLFKTQYTQKGFAPLYECLKWHESLIYPQGKTPYVLNQKDADNCNKIFASFGVEGVAFGVKNEDTAKTRENVAFDNALWVVEFLMRRYADGGQTFAQKFQQLALNAIQ